MDNITKTLEAVLLDWDDHLIDSTAYYKRSSEEAIEILISEHGYDRPEKLYRERGTQRSADYFGEVFGEEGKALVLSIREKILMDGNLPAPSLRPGAKELLTFLEINEIPYAIVSDTIQPRLENNVARVMESEDLPLPTMVGTSESTPMKPNPMAVNEALRLLSEKTGREISASSAVLMSGDKPNKDGQQAKNAGISHVIVSSEKSGDVSGWNVAENLEELTNALAKTVRKEVQRPRYFERFSYEGISREETHIITGDQDYIESPATDDATDGITLTEDEYALHDMRWIAKRGKHLDGTGDYSQEEKMEAGLKVVEELLNDRMVEEVATRVIAAARAKREATPDSDEKIIVHNPHIGYSKNMLRIAFIHELTNAVNKIIYERAPELNVEVRDGNDQGSPIFNVLSVQQSFEEIDGVDAEELGIESLTGHNVETSLTQKRSTGSLFERIVKQALFSYHNFEKDDLVILADDHVQAGATFVTLYQQLKSIGVNVVALTSLATIPESKNLQPHEEIFSDMAQAKKFALDAYMLDYPNSDPAKMAQKFDRSLDSALGKVGLSIGSLANREALTIMSCLVEGSQKEQLEWMEKTMVKYGCNTEVAERKGDSLMVQAEKKSITPVELENEIDKMVPKFTVKTR